MQSDAQRNEGSVSTTQYIQFAFFKASRDWRLRSEEDRELGRREFAEAVAADREIETSSYSTLGLRSDADFFLWRTAEAIEPLQESLGRILRTKLGKHLDLAHLFFGLTRGSVYARRPNPQQNVLGAPRRSQYFVVYPFTKTVEWYLLSQETRQGMMNEHIRIGRSYPSIRQLLAYSTGLADQEFIVAYETDRLDQFQDLVIALRSTEARRYTLRDTPIFTGIYRPLDETLTFLG